VAVLMSFLFSGGLCTIEQELEAIDYFGSVGMCLKFLLSNTFCGRHL
jgi:hypothetical protein